jgi:hypothetical protein
MGRWRSQPMGLFNRPLLLGDAAETLRVVGAGLAVGEGGLSNGGALALRGDLPAGLFCKIAVQPSSQKYFAFAVGQIISTSSPRPASIRGAYASSRTLGAGCGGRGSGARRAALARTAKSCGPDAPTLASSSCGDNPRERRWQKSPVTGESTKETVKTIAQGNAG